MQLAQCRGTLRTEVKENLESSIYSALFNGQPRQLGTQYTSLKTEIWDLYFSLYFTWGGWNGRHTMKRFFLTEVWYLNLTLHLSLFLSSPVVFCFLDEKYFFHNFGKSEGDANNWIWHQNCMPQYNAFFLLLFNLVGEILLK